MSETTNSTETASETVTPTSAEPLVTVTAKSQRKVKVAAAEDGIDLDSPLAQKILAFARAKAKAEFEAKEQKRLADEKLGRVRPMIETAREIMAAVEREAKGGDVDRILRALRKFSSPAQGAYLILRQTPGYVAHRGRPAHSAE